MARVVPCVLLLAALVLAPVIGGGYGELTNGIVQILVFAAVCAYVLFGRRDDRKWPVVPGAIALGVFLLFSVISVFFSECKYLSLRQVLFVFACAAAFLLASSLGRDTKRAAMLACGLAASALWICATSISEYARNTGGGANFWAAVMSSGDHWRLFGTFANPNFFSGFLVIALPVTLALYVASRRSSFALLFGLAFGVELAALAMTGSKFGTVSAAVALMVFLLFSVFRGCLGKRQFVKLLILSALLAPMVIALSGTVKTRVEAAKAGGEQSHSANFRLYTWKGTAQMIKAHPLTGVGPGTFEITFPRYTLAGFSSHAHQGYLQTAAESGVVALAGLLALLGAVGWAGIKGVSKPEIELEDAPASSEALTWDDVMPERGWQILACGLLGAFAGSITRNLVDSDWFVIGIALPFWTLAGLMVSRSTTARRSVEIAGWPKIVLLGTCAVGVALSASFGLGDWYASKGAEYGRSEMWVSMQHQYRLAADVSPLNPAYQRELAKFMDPDAAINQLDKAIRMAPTDSEGYWLRGLMAWKAGRTDLALKSFDESLKYRPHSTQTLSDMANVYHDARRTAEYEATLRRMLAIEQTDYEKVLGVPEKVDTRYAEAHIYFGEKYLGLKDYRRAVGEYEAAVSRLERWRSYPMYIDAAIEIGQLTKAKEAELIGTLRDSYFKLSEAYAGLGNQEKAAEARQKGETVVFRDTGGQGE